ncbi:MAG: hypothetical protein GSR84_03135 [Desulfurococcales archaeon]|nr:hypothetical protein [Desulfurococcales archaeon]
MQLEERLARLERILEAMLARPVHVHVSLPEKRDCAKAQLVVLMDYLLGRIRDAARRGDWGEALRTVEEVRERIYYYGLEELQKELGL